MNNNVPYLWNVNKNGKEYTNVVKKLKRDEMFNGLDFSNATDQVKTHVTLMGRDGTSMGIVADAFVVDDGKHVNTHYITTNGIIVIRDKDTNKAFRVTAGSPKKIRSYYDSLGYPVPSRIIDAARNRNRW